MRARMFAVLAALTARGSPGPVEFKQYASTDGPVQGALPRRGEDRDRGRASRQGRAEASRSTRWNCGARPRSWSPTSTPRTRSRRSRPAPRLDKVRDGNKGADGKVLEDKDLTVGAEKYPGRDVLIEKPDGCIRNRIVIAGQPPLPGDDPGAEGRGHVRLGRPVPRLVRGDQVNTLGSARGDRCSSAASGAHPTGGTVLPEGRGFTVAVPGQAEGIDADRRRPRSAI